MFAPPLAMMMLAFAATDAGYDREIADWRVQREAGLKKDDGWLTLVDLIWLKEGENRIAAGSTTVGTITLQGGIATFHPAKGVPLTLNGSAAAETVLKPDSGVIATRDLGVLPIKRGD